MASVNEPTVSVHGVPQSQYNAGQVPAPGNTESTGIIADMKAHPIWAVAIGLAVVALGFMVWQYLNGSSSSSNTTSGIDPATGVPYALEQSSVAGGTGAQSDANYQQLQSEIDTNNGLLQQLLNGTGNTTGGTTGTTTTGGTYTLSGGSTPNGVLGSGAEIFNNNGTWSFEAPGTNTPTALSSILPVGSVFYQGAQGRWWYELPGTNTQLLLTSGSGPGVVGGGMGTIQNPPKGAKTIVNNPVFKPAGA